MEIFQSSTDNSELYLSSYIASLEYTDEMLSFGLILCGNESMSRILQF